jgi:hypothetical protein
VVVNTAGPEEEASPRYILWHDVIAGWAGIDFDPNNQPVGSALCSAGRFKPLRQAAYEAYSISPLPVNKLDRTRITILGKSEQETRQFLEVDKAIAALTKSFLEVEVTYVEMMDMPPSKQAKILSETSVLITAVGSASFRLLLLPDGAAVVLVGAPLVWFLS